MALFTPVPSPSSTDYPLTLDPLRSPLPGLWASPRAVGCFPGLWASPWGFSARPQSWGRGPVTDSRAEQRGVQRRLVFLGLPLPSVLRGLRAAPVSGGGREGGCPMLPGRVFVSEVPGQRGLLVWLKLRRPAL